MTRLPVAHSFQPVAHSFHDFFRSKAPVDGSYVFHVCTRCREFFRHIIPLDYIHGGDSPLACGGHVRPMTQAEINEEALRWANRYYRNEPASPYDHE